MKENKISTLTDWKEFFDELQNESPRAAVIIASAFLDAQLRAILSNSFIDKSKAVNDLLDSDLRDFNTRIKLAYCMGLISESVYHDLNVIRKIRNKFAHEMQGYTFNEPEIVDWCKTLILAKMIADVTRFPKSHNDLFVFGVIQLASALGMKIIETEESHSQIAKDPEMAQAVCVDQS